DLATNDDRLFLRVPGGLVSHVAFAPDHRQLAYAVTYLNQAFSVQSSDIVVCDADGANPRTVVHEDEAGFSLGWVSWPNDPARLVYAKTNGSRGAERIEDVELSTGTRRLL